MEKVDFLEAAIRCLSDVLTDIRADWSDPRFDIRAGWDALDSVATGLKTEDEWREQWAFHPGWEDELSV